MSGVLPIRAHTWVKYDSLWPFQGTCVQLCIQGSMRALLRALDKKSTWRWKVNVSSMIWQARISIISLYSVRDAARKPARQRGDIHNFASSSCPSLRNHYEVPAGHVWFCFERTLFVEYISWLVSMRRGCNYPERYAYSKQL